MADTGVKSSFGKLKGSYERFCDHLIITTTNGQILRLDKSDIDDLESLMDWVAIERMRLVYAGLYALVQEIRAKPDGK